MNAVAERGKGYTARAAIKKGRQIGKMEVIRGIRFLTTLGVEAAKLQSVPGADNPRHPTPLHGPPGPHFYTRSVMYFPIGPYTPT